MVRKGLNFERLSRRLKILAKGITYASVAGGVMEKGREGMGSADRSEAQFYCKVSVTDLRS